jgi:hypothetical protein
MLAPTQPQHIDRSFLPQLFSFGGRGLPEGAAVSLPGSASDFLGGEDLELSLQAQLIKERGDPHLCVGDIADEVYIGLEQEQSG